MTLRITFVIKWVILVDIQVLKKITVTLINIFPYLILVDTTSNDVNFTENYVSVSYNNTML